MSLKIFDDLLLAVEDGSRRIKIHRLSHLEGDSFPLLVTEGSFFSALHLSDLVGRRTKSEGLNCEFGGKGEEF